MKKLLVLMVAMIVAAGAVQADEETAKKPRTKAKYMEMAAKKAEKSGEAFDVAKAEAAFAKRDKNGDGELSAEELTKKKK